MRTRLFLVAACAAFVAPALAHPGHDIETEALERREFIDRSTHLQAKCGKHLAASGFGERALRRRQQLAQGFRERRGLTDWPIVRSRDLSEVLNKDHHSDKTGVTFNTGADTLFGDNSSCLLQSETTEGPYYITGEYVRSNMTESQPGVPLMIDLQVIDVNTCKPFPKHYVEFWHCNSTGVYSGVVTNGNGNSKDASNINATFLRGIQATDDDGVVQMETIFPGHYTGRATHIHILVHGTGTVLSNKTLSGSSNTHVGQLFFDQDLITAVEKNNPYSGNTQSLTKNSADMILSGEANTTDPMVEYVYAGSDVSDGIVAWITVGVNSSLTKSVVAAGNYGSNGGVANSEGPGGGGGGPGPSGAPPSGAPSGGPMPSGAMPTGSASSNSSAPSATLSSAPAGASSSSSNAATTERFSFAKFVVSCLLGLLV